MCQVSYEDFRLHQDHSWCLYATNYLSSYSNKQLFWIILGGLRVTNPPIRLMCPTLMFPDSNSKMLCPIEFKLDREIHHHHS